ncbi:MAG: Isocitrate dehydrogenase, partial [Bacteroidota bacterium]
QKVGTQEFAEAVISNLGKTPNLLKSVYYAKHAALQLPKYIRKKQGVKKLEGVDLFVHWSGTDPNVLAETMNKIGTETLELTMITNRGIKVWPEGFKETFCTDHWRCRFKAKNTMHIHPQHIIDLFQNALNAKMDIIKSENLYSFDGKAAYSLGQGQ